MKRNATNFGGWEYRVSVLSSSEPFIDDALDALGAEGWELVSVLAGKADSNLEAFYLKRRKRRLRTFPSVAHENPIDFTERLRGATDHVLAVLREGRRDAPVDVPPVKYLSIARRNRIRLWLMRTECEFCGNIKLENVAFCESCMAALPGELQARQYLKGRDCGLPAVVEIRARDYERAYQEAYDLLTWCDEQPMMF